ncbi:MAG: type II toxin-antitoxin system VapC family toxin [Chloroflexi bacterium]|nr:type II toxin-antitoxin system VapC family toxin [Chloroflexota bacterium]
MSALEKLVVDANVAAKWYVPELDSEAASAILDRGDPLFAPDLIIAEFGNVVWKKVSKGELGQSEAVEIIRAFISSSPVVLRPATVFLSAAFDIAIRYNVTVYDALYLAVALDESCPLVIADKRLGQALRGTELEKAILVLRNL